MQDQQKPPSFPSLPKSALFSKLEAFLPVMAEENKKLDEAVAAGEGAKHNIEVEEDGGEKDEEDGDESMTRSDGEKEHKAPVIAMNFALGTMDEDRNDSDSETANPEAQVKTPKDTRKVEESLFKMRIEKPSNKPRPVIQELN
ncbi:hypothetical protein BBO99_00006767 [Phytophthora kernoviae]|uniref:Uncharacterized protein n=2 Tax=Phytophthora kernoviae TaxID=325452 RepID=A0A3R7MVR0_9STRA|nr:hypothetical protein G195_009929 [Phytophthora kernoviae 00238/432]KAG2513519.1 hypothetical protein JM16_006360 [Phytophthora kernoviae]KAG2517255.1 hypothetical protein JM18_005506 [Phytophthora kernoviae]RLN44498.1 hypothetical protein BBI17_006790 [Phytophthora kernoviae]RLN77421.1 hypothetical protein BBO99_00006767 [Phytophthora kernoviae]